MKNYQTSLYGNVHTPGNVLFKGFQNRGFLVLSQISSQEADFLRIFWIHDIFLTLRNMYLLKTKKTSKT